MKKPEIKTCPSCGKKFECKVNDIINCQCYGIDLNEEAKKLVEKEYGDCLCRSCLKKIKNKFLDNKTFN